MSPQKKARSHRKAISRLGYSQQRLAKIPEGRFVPALRRWLSAEQGVKLKPGWKVQLLTDPYLHKGELAAVAITRPDGKIIYKAVHSGEHPHAVDLQHTRLRVALHKVRKGLPHYPLQSNSILSILEEVSFSRQAHAPINDFTPYSFARLRAEANRHAFNMDANLVELIRHVASHFPNELRFRKAIRDMLREPRMQKALFMLNGIVIHPSEKHVFPAKVSDRMAKPLISVLNYLEKKAAASKKKTE